MQSALATVPQIKGVDLKADKAGGTASFKCPKDFDYKSKLEALAAANEHVKGWKVAN